MPTQKEKSSRARRKGETYQVAIEFHRAAGQWANMVSKLTKAYSACEEASPAGGP